MAKKTAFEIERVYDEPAGGGGLRILVDRVWPRGVSRDAAALDGWAKELAPSTELRKWFGHDPALFEPFRERYHAELDANRDVVDRYLAQWRGEKVTLLYGAKDREHNQAVVLRGYLQALV